MLSEDERIGALIWQMPVALDDTPLRESEMGRIAWITVALVLLTAAPVAQAGLLGLAEHVGEAAVKDAAKAGAKGAEATATGVKIENKGFEAAATGVSVDANGVKVENKFGLPGGGGGESGGGGGDAALLSWFFALCIVGGGGWLFWKFRGKRA